jgi:hypothetical protein
MNRDDFEQEYVERHMGYDPRNNESKRASVFRLRADHGYTDSHIDLCWKIQMIKDVADRGLRLRAINGLRW